MHSSIINQIFTTIWNWFMNFSYPWDSGSFTMFDYFKFCCVLYVIFYFVYHILLGLIHDKFYEMDLDYYLEEGYTLDGAMSMAEMNRE